ncbi:hypothetical protein PGTUg99_013307 [Puccinia graminis f. sp. tritici]|uniref:Uncharacterized protein n=1 Tax=Puccinia graminis f. sp. tritici TaxID=56615 RepID=A0A5B0SCV7_PUCGR|nr:hypothetical protein PGTUg99_013307 [Puccinia graminis f. sp. tritici]
MNPVAKPRHANSYDDAPDSRSNEENRSSPPGEPTRGILIATCDALLISTYPFAPPATKTPSPDGVDSGEREVVATLAASCLLTPATTSHLTTEVGALEAGALAARSIITADDRGNAALGETTHPSGGEPEDLEAKHHVSDTGFGLRTATPGEIVSLQNSEAAHNTRLRVNQPVGILEEYGESQTDFDGVIDTMEVLPVTAGRSEGLNLSPASTSSNLHFGNLTVRKSRDVNFPSSSKPSSSYEVSPLAEVTDAYTGSQGGWSLPLLAPDYDIKLQPFHHDTDRCGTTFTKSIQSKKADKKGKENESLDAKLWSHTSRPRSRGGQMFKNNFSADQSPAPAVRRGPLRI